MRTGENYVNKAQKSANQFSAKLRGNLGSFVRVVSFVVICVFYVIMDAQGGTSILGGWRWFRPDIKFSCKIWGKVQSSSPNKRKNLGSSVTTIRKYWERITALGAFGVISEIQRAKFGVFVT